MNDFNTDHLSGKSKKIADGIVEWLTERYKRFDEKPDGGGCKAFYSPKEWKARGESYGADSLLIICHDGGDLAHLCNFDYECYKAMEEFRVFLRDTYGVRPEPCTCWYTAVYPDS
jgi:hypothetical protein